MIAATRVVHVVEGARARRAGARLVEPEDVPLAELPVPGACGPFQLVRELGRGGMAVVYEGRRDGGTAALKVPRSAPSGTGAVLREARLLGACTHAGLVRLRGLVPGSDCPVLVLELVSGENLETLLRRHAVLPAGVVRRALEPVARALAHMHERSIVHRDVKPANVMVRPDGRGVLLDLGLARGPEDPRQEPGMTMGTPMFMAPEHLRGNEVGPAADVFSLGVVLYEALTGRPPHLARSVVELAAARRRAAPPAGELAPVDPRLESLVERCLRHEPTDRPCMAEVAQELAPRDLRAR